MIAHPIDSCAIFETTLNKLASLSAFHHSKYLNRQRLQIMQKCGLLPPDVNQKNEETFDITQPFLLDFSSPS